MSHKKEDLIPGYGYIELQFDKEYERKNSVTYTRKNSEIELESKRSKILRININTYSEYLIKIDLLNQPWSI